MAAANYLAFTDPLYVGTHSVDKYIFAPTGSRKRNLDAVHYAVVVDLYLFSIYLPAVTNLIIVSSSIEFISVFPTLFAVSAPQHSMLVVHCRLIASYNLRSICRCPALILISVL